MLAYAPRGYDYSQHEMKSKPSAQLHCMLQRPAQMMQELLV